MEGGDIWRGKRDVGGGEEVIEGVSEGRGSLEGYKVGGRGEGASWRGIKMEVKEEGIAVGL